MLQITEINTDFSIFSRKSVKKNKCTRLGIINLRHYQKEINNQ